MPLFLTAITDKIQVVTAQAVTVDVLSNYVDVTNADPPIVQGDSINRTATAITTATTTDIVPVPASGDIRNVRSIFIRNKHASTSVDITVQFNANGNIYELFKATLVPQASLIYNDELGTFYLVSPVIATTLLKVLTADDTGGTNVATAQPWFPIAGGVTVVAATTYEMEGLLVISRAAGVTSHTISQLFGGTATLTSIQYVAETNVGETEALLPESRVTSRIATATVVTAASTTASEQKQIKIKGWVRINAAGTFIPQFQYSVAPGGTPTIKANSSFKLTPVGDNNFANQGIWA